MSQYYRGNGVVHSSGGIETIDADDFIKIYNLKKQPYSCACNLESLFDNWNKKDTGISNADDVTLISYTYIGTIRDTAHILEYADRLFEPESLGGGFGRHGGSGPIFTMTVRELEEYNRSRYSPAEYEKVFGDEREYMGEYYLMRLRPGDMIFSVKFRFKGHDEPYDVFVFCDPERNFVVQAFNFGTTLSIRSRGRRRTESGGVLRKSNTSRRNQSGDTTTKPYFNSNPSPFSDPF